MHIKDFPFIYKLGLKIKHYYLLSITKRKLKTYLLDSVIKRLQIGSGQNSLEGWFNTDYFQRDRIYFLDATKHLPFPSSSFQYVFSEHHIEHIHYNDAKLLFQEAFRILKPGGIIRICTPNLSEYLKSYFLNEPLSNPYINEIMENWIKNGFHNAKNYVPKNGLENVSFFINDIFLNYEHKFIYDEKTLIQLLIETGFSNAKTGKPGISEYTLLSNIESHSPNDFTLVIEAIK